MIVIFVMRDACLMGHGSLELGVRPSPGPSATSLEPWATSAGLSSMHQASSLQHQASRILFLCFNSLWLINCRFQLINALIKWLMTLIGDYSHFSVIHNINLRILLVFCGTNLIVGILWHESHWPASQRANHGILGGGIPAPTALPPPPTIRFAPQNPDISN